MTIEIFGDGTSHYRSLFENTRKAIISLKIIAPITTPQERAPYHHHTAEPALYINAKLICAGHAISETQIAKSLSNALK